MDTTAEIKVYRRYNSLMTKRNAAIVQSNGINHLAIATGDMGETIRFWKDMISS
jgi:hypothetical protein